MDQFMFKKFDPQHKFLFVPPSLLWAKAFRFNNKGKLVGSKWQKVKKIISRFFLEGKKGDSNKLEVLRITSYHFDSGFTNCVIFVIQ